MSRLVHLYILAAGENLHLLNLSQSNQLSNEDLGIGIDTWAKLVELEQEYDTKPFFEAARKFYVATLKKMIVKFPFSDSEYFNQREPAVTRQQQL